MDASTADPKVTVPGRCSKLVDLQPPHPTQTQTWALHNLRFLLIICLSVSTHTP